MIFDHADEFPEFPSSGEVSADTLHRIGSRATLDGRLLLSELLLKRPPGCEQLAAAIVSQEVPEFREGKVEASSVCLELLARVSLVVLDELSERIPGLRHQDDDDLEVADVAPSRSAELDDRPANLCSPLSLRSGGGTAVFATLRG